MTLSKIKIYSVCQKWASDNRHYIFANDKDLVNNFINLSKEKFIGEAEVAMLVGNSYLFSLAHHILIKGYQTVYICDIDPSVLRFIKYVYHIIKYVSDYEEFVYSIKSGIQKEYSDFSTAAIEKYFNIELKTIGDKHFLFSQNNFDLAKLALAELDIHLVQINLSSKSAITSFSADLRLKKQKIAFANFTNYGDYYDLCSSALGILPFREEALIAYSLSPWMDGKILSTIIQSSIYTQGLKCWIAEYKIRKKIYFAIHGNAYDLNENDRKQQKNIDLKVLSGEWDCINTANTLGISPLAHFSIDNGDNEHFFENLSELLQFSIEKSVIEDMIYQLNVNSNRHGYFFSKNKKVINLLKKKLNEEKAVTQNSMSIDCSCFF